MTQVIVGDLRTGRRWQNVPFDSCSWEQRRNEAETVKAVIPMLDRDVQRLNLRNSATEGKSYLAVIEGTDVITGAGPMLKPDYDQDTGKLTLNGFGIQVALAARTVQKPVAYTISPSMFVVVDPADATATIPNPALATRFTGVDYGTMMRGLVAQALAAPGGDLPIVLEAARAGTREKGWEGIDFKPVWDAISDIAQLERGPDVQFTPRWLPSRLGLEWAMRTGTEAQPRLQSSTVHRWDLSVANKSTRGLKVTGDASSTGSVAWFTGGRSSDVALVERVVDSYLTDLGFPLREIIDSSHSTVSERATLAAYAREAVALGRRSSRFWSFEVRKDQTPLFGQYRVGDLCRLIVRNDPYIPDSPQGGYVREIAGLSGDEGLWVKVTTSEAFDG